MPYVYSTASSDQAYSSWHNGGGDLKNSTVIAIIRGGANIIGKNFQTPRGVATKVTQEQLDQLLKNPAFIRHKDRGFISVDKDEVSAEKKANSMEKQDKSAPLTDDSFTGKNKPKLNKKAKED
jgi:hypothetical protein